MKQSKRYMLVFALCAMAEFIFCRASFAATAEATITRVAGTGEAGYSGDGGPALQAKLGFVPSFVFDTNGNLYFTDHFAYVIRRITPSGTIQLIAGTPGVFGYSGDGGPAKSAKMHIPQNLVLDSSENLYVAHNDQLTTGSYVIRKVTPGANGTITTVRRVGLPPCLATNPNNGKLYYCRAGAIYKLTISGNADGSDDVKVAGDGPYALGNAGDGGPATEATFSGAMDIAFDQAGNLYIADMTYNRIRKVTTDGIIHPYAGTGLAGGKMASGNSIGDGGPALQAKLSKPGYPCFDSAGNLYFHEYERQRIRKITPQGVISTVAGNGDDAPVLNEGGPAVQAIGWLGGIAVNSQNEIFFNHREDQVIHTDSPPVKGTIWKVKSAQPASTMPSVNIQPGEIKPKIKPLPLPSLTEECVGPMPTGPGCK